MTCAEKVLCFLFLMNLFAFAIFDYFDYYYYYYYHYYYYFFSECVFCHENVATDKKYLGLLFFGFFDIFVECVFCYETFL